MPQDVRHWLKFFLIGSDWLSIMALYLTVVTVTAIVAWRLILLFDQKKSSTSWLKKLSLSLFSVLYLLALLEYIFVLTMFQSDGFGFTKSAKRWHSVYWHPINSYGYRDYEPEWKKRTLFVVGDSFVAGHGVKNIDHRFSNKLANLLGDPWTVTIIAKNSWGTVDQYRALQTHDVKPEKIILSYFMNDIEHAAALNGLRFDFVIPSPPAWANSFIDQSYLANFLYWQLFRDTLSYSNYWSFLQKAYSNPRVLETHFQELDQIIQHANSINAEISFVIWPHLTEIEKSQQLLSAVIRHLEERSLKVLDLAPCFRNENADDLIVNRLDHHPNPDTHSKVARLIYDQLGPWSD